MDTFKKLPVIIFVFFLIAIVACHDEKPVAKPPQPKPHDPITEELGNHPFRIITVAVPSIALARAFSRDLVTQGLAASVNVFPSAVSVYVWNGELVETPEIILFIYTHVNQYEKIEHFIRVNHVHVEPGIVSFPIVGGSKSYLRWLETQVKTAHPNVHDSPRNNMMFG